MNSKTSDSFYPLSLHAQWMLAIAGLCLTAFGQPVWHPWIGLAAAIGGYALFWRVLLAHPKPKKRFWISTAWFCCVQLIQLSWFISHPFLYIYSVYIFLSVAMGIQFGIIGLFITPSILRSFWQIITLAALWTIFEWSRLFFLSGFSFNPIGLALTGSLYSLQMASLAGIFGLSFWVVLVNLLGLRAWMFRKQGIILAWICASLLPYGYGTLQLSIHANHFTYENPFKALLVQTAFPVEEAPDSPAKKDMVGYVLNEWKQILEITHKHNGQPIDLIVLPEFVVPFGTYSFVFPFNKALQIFYEVFGQEGLKALPSPQWPYCAVQQGTHGLELLVDNAYWVQAMANYFQAHVLAGLEDAEDISLNEREYYSAALLFKPQNGTEHLSFEDHVFPKRYEKRVLVPMGEYIPFSYLRELAASYGVMGSFTCGKEAKLMDCNGILISPSICYEETYGHLISEGRKKGAGLLVNLTSDVWYPNSQLPRQHLDHARPRTVENGIPLIRACNTGVTAAIDSLGRTVAVLGGEHPEEKEWEADALLVDVPLYHYWTPFAFFGDYLLISICGTIVCAALFLYMFTRY